MERGATFSPFTTLLKQLNALETFEDATFGSYVAGFLEAGVL